MNAADRLRAAYADRAAHAAPSPDAYDSIRARSRRRRRERRVLAVAAAVPAVAAIAFAVRVPDRQVLTPVTTVTPTTSPAPTESPSPSPSLTADPSAVAADQFVAVTGERTLAVLSSRDGSVVRELKQYPQMDLGHVHYTLALSPDRRTVYVGRYDTEVGDCEHGGAGMIESVDVATGAVREVTGSGTDPELSPDGTRLAFIRGCAGERSRVVVRDLATGAEQEFPTRSDDVVRDGGEWYLGDVVWTAHPDRLALLLSWEELGELRVLDLTSDHDIKDATVLDQRADMVVERSGADLLVVTNCCYPEHDSGRLDVRDSVTGRRTLVAESDDAIGEVAADDSGRILFTSAHRLYAAGGDGGATPVADHYLMALDW